MRRVISSQSSSVQKSCDLKTNTLGLDSVRSLNQNYSRSLSQSADKFDYNKPEQRKVGEVVYSRTYAGPIVRVTVVEVTSGGFNGTISAEDNRRVYLAGAPECPVDFVSKFFDTQVSTLEEYEKQDWKKCITRVEKNKRKLSKNVFT